ncbi:MAG: rod shape-determining protein MreC [Lachnospiraceae bacterium]|jgi:rod shape-determining protein MreC|nr:rod shape-determining protein MreC [Lachnospiraceae bacterium]
MKNRRNKSTKFTLPSKYLLLILTAVCVMLMAITFLTDFPSTPVSNLFGFVIMPFETGISRVGVYLNDRTEELAQIRELLEENKRLKEEIDALTIENNALQQDKYELNSLRELYKLDEQYEDYEKVGARVIAKNAGNWFGSFVIDKGSNDGIAVDMNVMAGSGLVGRVTEVGKNWAKVISVIDDNSNVSSMILSTEDRLIVSGDLMTMNQRGSITFSQLVLGEGNTVSVGDKVVTSYISDKYLPGILIGYISEVNGDSNNLTQSGYITPAVDFAHMEEVLVVMNLKEQIDEKEAKAED